MSGFSLTSGSGEGFNLGGSSTSGFVLQNETSDPGSIYALDSPSKMQGSYAGYVADAAEASKMTPFYPANGLSWFENLAQYGVSKAIDAHFGTVAINKTTTGATAAGDNGKTYTVGGQQEATIAGIPLIWVLVIGGALFYASAD